METTINTRQVMGMVGMGMGELDNCLMPTKMGMKKIGEMILYI